jgi:nicotinate-nucleotide adenylyltransferase
MVELALRGTGELRADPVEIRRAGVSWTVDTLARLRHDAGGDSLCWIVGSDAYRGLDRWREWRRLLEYAHIVVASRSGVAAEDRPPAVRDVEQDRRATDAAELRASPAGRILHVAIPSLDISSTRIRSMIAAGRSPHYLVPEPVIDYIREQGLYRESP